MKETHRTNIAAYVSAQRHLRGDRKSAKTLTQMAKEIGTTKSTVRRWLRRDHWLLWMEYWASAEEIWKPNNRHERRSARLTGTVKRHSWRTWIAAWRSLRLAIRSTR